MPTFNWKELQKSELRLFDEKFDYLMMLDPEGGAFSHDTIEVTMKVKSNLLSSNQRSALAVIGEMRKTINDIKIIEERLTIPTSTTPKYRVIPLTDYSKGFNSALTTLTKLLDELEAEIK